jgi:hypothetical protein
MTTNGTRSDVCHRGGVGGGVRVHKRLNEVIAVAR